MRRTILISIILFKAFTIIAQPATSDPAQSHGDTVSITGRIYSGNFLKNVITKPTFLNVYDSSPLHMLLIRIDSGDRKNFDVAPEILYLNKKITVKGVLGDYKGISLIKIVNPSAITVDKYDRGPEPITNTGSYMSGQSFGFGTADSLFRKKQDSVKVILAKDPARRKLYAQPKPAAATDEKQEAKPEVKPVPAVEPVTPVPVPVEKEVAQPVDSTSKPVVVAEAAPVPVTDINALPAKAETVPEAPAQTEKTVEDTTTDTQIAAEVAKEIKPETNVSPKVPTVPSDTTSKAAWLKSISSQEFEPVDEQLQIKNVDIEMRTAPTQDAPVLAYLMKQMTIHVTFRSKKWSYVTVMNPDGTVGLSGFIKNKVYKNLYPKG